MDNNTPLELDAAFRPAIDSLRGVGYALLAGVVSSEACGKLRAQLDEVSVLEKVAGHAWVEPPNGHRVWMLLNKGRSFVSLACTPWVVSIADSLIGAPSLLSNVTANVVGPGARAQELHTDQGFLPRDITIPMVLTAIWMLDPFTTENGATLVIPGSHVNDGAGIAPVSVTACAGSVLLMDGRVSHAAGASSPGAPLRRAIVVNYCSPVLRQQENWWRSIAPHVVADADALLLRLLGDQLYNTLGMVNGLHSTLRASAEALFGPTFK